jgi:hypothetical protein
MVNVRAATTRIRPATSAPMIGRAAKQAARSFLGVNVWRRKQLLRRGEFITFLRRNYYTVCGIDPQKT